MGALTRFRSAAPGITAGVLIALWVWPATHWLIHAQVALVVPAHSLLEACPAGFEADDRTTSHGVPVATTANHPDDYLLQLAAAVAPNAEDSRSSAAEAVHRLRAMEARYPDRPSVYANALRFASFNDVVIQRNEPAMLSGDAELSDFIRGAPRVTPPEQLAAFDRDASTGERLDPNNAYFPLMRAVGLFAAKRNDDALAEIVRAGKDSSWNEYWNDELEGRWRQKEARCGHVSALVRAMTWGEILYPHLRAIRAASCLAIFRAAEAERAGRIEEGLVIRRAVRNYSDLILRQAPSVIASLVAISLGRLSVLRPGGAIDHLSSSASRAPQQPQLQQRLRDFDAFLRRSGHAGDVAEVHAQLSAGTAAREAVMLGIGGEPWASVCALCAWWLADLCVLSNALWMLVASGAAALVAKRARKGSNAGESRRHWTAHVITAGLLAGLGAIYFLQTKAMVAEVLPIVRLYRNIVGNERQDWLSRPLALLLSGSGIVAVLLLVLACGVSSLRRRVPLSVGVSRALHGWAPPIVSTLAVVYVLLALGTVRLEAVVNAGIQRCARQEGRCLAETSGRAWPGPGER